MTTLVLYDSNYGNTKTIADAIARELGTTAVSVVEMVPERLTGIELLVVGSPIIGWRPSARVGTWLASLKPGQLTGIKVATFDTRVRLFIHGDAAKQMSKLLHQAGASLMVEPSWFYVKGKTGPLLDGEVDKATAWAKTLLM